MKRPTTDDAFSPGIPGPANRNPPSRPRRRAAGPPLGIPAATGLPLEEPPANGGAEPPPDTWPDAAASPTPLTLLERSPAAALGLYTFAAAAFGAGPDAARSGLVVAAAGNDRRGVWLASVSQPVPENRRREAGNDNEGLRKSNRPVTFVAGSRIIVADPLTASRFRIRPAPAPDHRPALRAATPAPAAFYMSRSRNSRDKTDAEDAAAESRKPSATAGPDGAGDGGGNHSKTEGGESRSSHQLAWPVSREHAIEQLELFAEITPEGYSNTIELFDAVPKYFILRPSINSLDDIEPMRRDFKFRNRDYISEISPVILKRRKSQKNKVLYPGKREELVEKAIRKIAAEKMEQINLQYSNAGTPEIGVYFTLYELRKELGAHNHEYKVSELREALDILSQAVLTIYRIEEGKEKAIRSPIFQSLTYNMKLQDDTGNKSYVFVRFHPLVRDSILALTYRQINYKLLMTLRKPLARWLFERMSHVFVQAEKGFTDKGYHISSDTILRESGMKVYKEVRKSLAEIDKALEEMKENNILNTLRPYTRERKFETVQTAKGKRRKIVGAVYTLYPSDMVVEDIIRVNKTVRNISRGLPERGGDGRSGARRRKPRIRED